MRKRLHISALILLILSSNAFGGGNKTKTAQKILFKEKATDRIKRFADYDENDGQFWANRGKRQVTHKDLTKDDIDQQVNRKFPNIKNKLYNEPPFWGNRGRRSSEENYNDQSYSDLVFGDNDYYSFRTKQKLNGHPSLKDRRENTIPFWGNRGRRNSDEIPVDNDVSPFWSSRGRRQEEEPFWGTRGRRENNLPFWGNRGRRDNEPFWGSRGRREENEPFWGNRGRRQDEEPFWGNRGKKEDEEPFWGNRGKKELDSTEPFWGNRGRRKDDLKESIMEAINKVESDIDYLSRLKKDATEYNGRFWKNRGRESQLKGLFDGNRLKNQHGVERIPSELTVKPSVSSTLLDDRIYADQPHYILVERSSRSSAESLDPYFISRGKKKYFKTSRDRRNAIEEIVKSVRNDPFYIARGKKDSHNMNLTNSKTRDGFLKAKEVICATIELTLMNNENKVVKREINEDRDRRNILKKLAAQIQNDPYFVSRGKKNETNENEVDEFISQIAAMCN
uniref:Natalisin n=1 Tax=Cydia pomonella TaxID=82600 RepID=A0A514YLM1_CYDPO|nr:natalisin [Cydia pomonella]